MVTIKQQSTEEFVVAWETQKVPHSPLTWNAVLCIFATASGPTTNSAIANKLKVSSVGVGHITRLMFLAGIIQRAKNPTSPNGVGYLYRLGGK